MHIHAQVLKRLDCPWMHLCRFIQFSVNSEQLLLFRILITLQLVSIYLQINCTRSQIITPS